MDQYIWLKALGALGALTYLFSSFKKNKSDINGTPAPQFQMVRPMPQRISQVAEPEDPGECHVVEPFAPAPTTRSLLFSALDKLNLDYELDEDNSILIKYQGESLQILADDGKKYILIRDLWWYRAPLDDIENLSILHRAVNECNLENAVNVIAYTQHTDDMTINLHSFRTLLWIPEIPDIEQYFLSALDHILYMHHKFYDKMENIRREKHVETSH